jgi:hypothetical protein
MSRGGDPIVTAFAVKRNVALLREARSVLRRLDKLIADAAGFETSTTPPAV